MGAHGEAPRGIPGSQPESSWVWPQIPESLGHRRSAARWRGTAFSVCRLRVPAPQEEVHPSSRSRAAMLRPGRIRSSRRNGSLEPRGQAARPLEAGCLERQRDSHFHCQPLVSSPRIAEVGDTPPHIRRWFKTYSTSLDWWPSGSRTGSAGGHLYPGHTLCGQTSQVHRQ